MTLPAKLTADQLTIAGDAPATPAAGVCGICSTTEGVRFYQTGHRCEQHKPRPRTDFYGIQIPITERQYDPDRLARLGVADQIIKFRAAPDPDTTTKFTCPRCTTVIPVHDPDDIALTWHNHYRTKHAEGGWKVGPAGGANERTCGPCGGESPGGFHRINGTDVELPPKGTQFGVTFASSRHDLCQDGVKKGKYTIHCDCQHRTGYQAPHTP